MVVSVVVRYPLRGKFLNPRDSGVKSEKIASNKCIQDLIKILGLRRHIDYRDEKVFKTLRYGHCMIMADQDNDGSHIKGLVINFLHWYNHTLLKVPGYVRWRLLHLVRSWLLDCARVPFEHARSFGVALRRAFFGW